MNPWNVIKIYNVCMVKCCVYFAVRTELLNNNRVPAVLLQEATVATWATVATCVTVKTKATVVLERPWRLAQTWRPEPLVRLGRDRRVCLFELRLGLVMSGQIRLGQARSGQVWFGLVGSGKVRLGYVRFG
jgi:hypothetical protein